MSRPSNRMLAGLSASALAALMCQTALAGVDVHVPPVHISVPTVHVSVPTVGINVAGFKTNNTTVNSSTSRRDHQSDGRDRGGRNTPIAVATYRGTTVGGAVYNTTYVPLRRDLPKGDRNGGSQTASNGVSVATTTVPGASGREWPRGGTGTGSPGSTGAEWTAWHLIPWNWNIPWGILQVLEQDSEISTLFNNSGCTLPSSNNPGTGHDIQIVTGQDNANGGVWVSVSWSPSNGTPGGADQGGPNTGTITENANGTYSITFSWGYGTHVFTGTISPNGNGTWSLTGTVVVYNSQGQPEQGQGPGTGTCTLT
jgi:hypothetical protein